MALFDQNPGMIGPLTTPNTNSEVDFNNETVQGRIGGILKTDGMGNYTDPVVRQAVDRQDQAFNARGLRNSSIAVQGGTEAAISKAIDIAAPDAKTYYDNRRSNVDTGNQFARDRLGAEVDYAKQQSQQNFDLTKQKNQQTFDASQKLGEQGFTLRQDYQKTLASISTNFQRQIDTINASDMEPADKSVAIAQAQQQRDGEVAFYNNLFSRMPQWQAEWTNPAVPSSIVNTPGLNLDTLYTIANDPGQPQEVRDSALAQINAASAPAPAAAPAAPAQPSMVFPSPYDPWGNGGGFNGTLV